MAKLKLDMDGLGDDFFAGSRLLGIMSQIKNYRFCWLVNERMNVDFRLDPDCEIQLNKKGRNYFFEVYSFFEPDGELQHYIYHNQHEGEYLLPGFKHFDFLWLVKATLIPGDNFISLQKKLKEISGVQLVTELTHEKIRNKENLIL